MYEHINLKDAIKFFLTNFSIAILFSLNFYAYGTYIHTHTHPVCPIPVLDDLIRPSEKKGKTTTDYHTHTTRAQYIIMVQ